jgi:AraC family transcriptional regulator of adaptative response / DNA-3-methyladenine glycosylase II
VAFRPPFDFDHLLSFLAARALPGVERADGAGYARTLELTTGPAVVRVRGFGARSAPQLRTTGASPAERPAVAARFRRAFDLDADPTDVARVLGRDALLAPLVRRRPGLRIPGAWDTFECAARALLGQQVTVAAGRTFVARLVARAATTLPRPLHGLTHVFPSPGAVAAADLAGIGLTTARAEALRGLAQAVADGRLDLDGPPCDVIAGLVRFPGIGPWTAQYVALRALGDHDAFPAADLVLRRAAAGGGPPLSARALADRAEAWRPYRGYAAVHLWNAAAARRA